MILGRRMTVDDERSWIRAASLNCLLGTRPLRMRLAPDSAGMFEQTITIGAQLVHGSELLTDVGANLAGRRRTEAFPHRSATEAARVGEAGSSLQIRANLTAPSSRTRRGPALPRPARERQKTTTW